MPASLVRAWGGVLSDRAGARKVLWWTFGVSAVCTLILSAPTAEGAAPALGATTFVGVTLVLGFVMALGKAAVYKHIPVYYPDRVGAVGGLVGMIGGLGGFVLPIAFGGLKDVTGLWSSSFMLLFLLVGTCFVWMSLAVRRLERGGLAARST